MTHPGADDAQEAWRIGDLDLDVGQQRLWRDGAEIALPKLSFDLLLALARRAPDVVTYDELMERVWPGLVVSPETIVQRVRLLRTAIGDDASEPRYIEALRSRGYRLLAGATRVARAARPSGSVPPAAPLDPVAAPVPAAVAPASSELAPALATARSSAHRAAPRRTPSNLPWVVIGVAVAVASIVMLWMSRPESSPPSTVRDAAPSPGLATEVEATARATRTVAVLPFENLSAAPADAFIALTVPESMLDRLAGLRGLTVIARDSAFRAGREGRSASEIGERLGAGWLVQGSVQRVGERVRVAARLVDARADAQVWSERYDRPLAALPALQDEIAARLADALASRLAGLQRASQARAYSRNVEANLAYLRGRALLDRTTVAESDAAAVQFEEAIARDESFAAAHAALYDARLQAASLRRIGVAAARQQYAPLLGRAFALDPGCFAAYLARARWSAADPAAREADFRRGLELEPSHARGIDAYATFLQQQGRGPESARWLERELLVDPLSAPAHFRRAMQTLETDGAGVERAMLGALERDPNFYPALQRYAKYRWQLSGEIAQAIEIIERAIASDPDNPWGRHTAAAFYLDIGDPAAARDVAQGAPASASSTRTLLALYERRDEIAARTALELGALVFNSFESWGVPESLRDAALRAGAPADSAYERLLAAQFASGKRLADPATIVLGTYRARILLAQLQLVRATRGGSSTGREAALADLRALLAWMNANERFGLHHHPRALVLMLLGETDRAIDELAAAFAMDRDYRQWWYVLERDSTWLPLHADPRFKAIGDAVRAHVRREREALETLRSQGKVPRRLTGRP